MNTQKVISENKKRLDDLFCGYDPVMGTNSPIDRFRLYVDSDSYMYVPVTMKNDPVIKPFLSQSVSDFLHSRSSIGLYADAIKAITNIRIKHDFEFWAATCVKITDKMTKAPVPFILNRPQRKVLKILEGKRVAGVPIRILMGKARQWGGSTLILFWYTWIQLFHKVNWHSAIIAQVEEQSRNIRGMLSRMAQLHPREVAPVTLKPYEGSNKNKMIRERGNIVGIGSVEKPDNLRSFDFSMLHESEVGLWGETVSKSPEDLDQSLVSTVPQVPYSSIIRESTAKGVGNYWHRLWKKAKEKKSGYDPVFVPWYEIEIYTKKVPDYAKLIESMTEYEWYQWERGATLEGIYWYRCFMYEEGYSEWRMKSEYPTDDVEMFQSTGNRVFPQNDVLAARKFCYDPVFVGDLHGDERLGPASLKGIRFQPSASGRLLVWDKPDVSQVVRYRYVVFADIGGKSDGADWSTIKVFDRFPMVDGGVPEVVAVWRGHVDQDIFAWICVQVGTWYNNALVAIESNKLRKDIKSSEGDFFLTVLDEIAPHYNNLYARNASPDKLKEGQPLKYGFHTTQGNKELIISTLRKALREQGYFEKHEYTCDELDTFENKPDGSMGAVEGAHDDMVIVTAGGLYLSLKYLPLPVIVNKKPVKIIQKRNKSEAVI